MAVEFKTEHTRRTVYLFDPRHLIIKSELNGRQEAPDVEPLITDILEHGQLQPVLVRMDEGKPVLVAGFCRWRAISAINSRKLTDKPLPIQCVYFRGNERAGFLANLAENLQRNATTPLDDAHNCQLLESWGMATKEIAEKLRKSEAWVRGRLKIAAATPELQEAVKTGRVKETAAATIAALSEAQQKSIVKGNGKVTAPPSGKPSAKDLREFIVESYGNMDLPESVKAFCREIIARHWPAELKAEEQSSDV